MAGARSLCLLNQNPEASQDKVFRICRHLLNYCFTARKVLRVWRKLKPKETAPVDCGLWRVQGLRTTREERRNSVNISPACTA